MNWRPPLYSRIKIDRETAERVVEHAEKFIRRMKEYLKEVGGDLRSQSTNVPHYQTSEGGAALANRKTSRAKEFG